MSCAIELRLVATLSDSADPGLFALGRSLSVQRDGRGRYFTATYSGDRVAVFDSAGRLQNQLGRRGSGPGEFQRAGVISPGPDDSLYVADERLRRITVFAPDLTVARTFHAAHSPSFVQQDGTFIVARQLHNPESIGYPLHRYDAEGRLLRSFGADTPQYRTDLTRLVNRVAAPSRDGTIWSVAPGKYVLERWNPQTGERVARFPVNATWFTESTNADKPDYERPDPVIVALWEDEAGIVWVLARIADELWRPPSAAEARMERVFDIAEYSRTYDWMLEAVDPVSGFVHASRRLKDYVGHRPPAQLLVSLSSMSDHASTLDVWQPILQPGGRDR